MNGDVHLGLATQPALRTFGDLAQLTHPGTMYDNVGGLAGPLVRLFAKPVMAAISYAFTLLHIGTNAIGARVSQRAEYYADDLAARAAGTTAALGLTDVLTASIGLTTVIGGRARSKALGADWQETATRVRVDMAPRCPGCASSPGATRPRSSPLTRRQVCDTRCSQPRHRAPAVVLTEERSRLIDAELARYEERYRRIMVESW